MEAPKIVVEPPGPKAREIIEKDHSLIMQSFARWYPLVVETAEGAIVRDVDGNTYIDLNSGLVVVNVGHKNPYVIDAVKRQVEKLIHYSLTDFYYEEAVRAAEKLVSIAPVAKPAKVFYTNSGAESIEATIKISRGHFRGQRPYIIAFLGAFHGRTYGAMSLTASKPVQRKSFYPLVPGVIHVPYPYPYRCPFRVEDPKECGEAVVGYIEEWILGKMVYPSEVSLIIAEPIQGEGGYIVPPDNFFPLLRKLADKHGILLASDEVQAGFARTGKWFAIEHWGVKPDLVAMAKGIANGLPLGAVVGRAEVMDLPPGSHANTFGGNPVSLAASMAVIEYIERNNLLERVSRLGEEVKKYFNDLASEVSLIGDVRGKGFMIGVELVKDRDTKEPAREELATVLKESFKRGVLVIGAGASTIRIAPPLTIEEELLFKALDVIADVLRSIDRSRR